MFLSAQRVLSRHGVSGVNAYAYRHPPGTWSTADLSALENTAVLFVQDIEVPPGGNAVRSYLDIFAPDGAGPAAIAAWIQRLRTGPERGEFPIELREGDLALRFGLVFGLVSTWQRELTDLAARILLLVQSAATTTDSRT
jgi:hypothetical protein